MRTALIACAIAIGSAAPLGVDSTNGTATAAIAAPAPTPEFTFTGNAGLFSDYRYRGYSQTDYKPAFQGGFDFAHKSGFYLGNWNSNVSSVLFNGASLEMDFYGGYKATFGDFGSMSACSTTTTRAPASTCPATSRNLRGYIGGTWGPLSLKYFYGFTDYFDTRQRPASTPRGRSTSTLSAACRSTAVGPIRRTPAGRRSTTRQQVGLIEDTYFDYKLGVTYDIAGSGWLAGLRSVSEPTKRSCF